MQMIDDLKVRQFYFVLSWNLLPLESFKSFDSNHILYPKIWSAGT